ncbi:hypothetical protein [Rhodopila sp.]|uniref:hypothetical protein n=1 Tax=Rhodopila sp. TaxID=2480087 RepID=UPI003D14BB6E
MDKRNQELRDLGNALRAKQAQDAANMAAIRQRNHNATMENYRVQAKVQALNESIQRAPNRSSWVQPSVGTGAGMEGADRNDAWRLVALAVAGFAGWKTFLAVQPTYPVGGALLTGAIVAILAYMVANSYVVRKLTLALLKVAAVLAFVGVALYAFSHFIR